jgi:hypothetical protein
MVKSVRLSESDRFLLETLGKFCVRARHSNWENVTHSNDTEAMMFMREMSPMITHNEYRNLMQGWGDIRLQGNDTQLNKAVEDITQRLQQRVESY